MHTNPPDDILARLCEGAVCDDELLELAGWAMTEPARVAQLRARWPSDRLPVVGDYFCVARLGHGSFGVVFKALAMRREPAFVALKVLQLGAADAEERFREREIEILKTVNCPRVARYLDSGAAGGSTYLAMELVAGRTLDEYLSECPRALEDKLEVFRHLCEAVADLHDQGVIHRDLKPKHVLVDETGRPTLVDLGLSAALGEDWPTRVRRARTELGNVLGTVKYMSPEQAWGGLLHVDHRADIWSLGIMLYEIVTDGEYPYALDPVGELTGHDALLHRIQTEMPRKPRIAAARYAEALSTLVSRCLTYEPHRRMDSARTLAGDLGRCLACRPIRTRRLPIRYRAARIARGLTTHWRTGLWGATISAVLLLLLLVSVVFAVRWEVVGVDYGLATRQALAAFGSPVRDHLAVIGITDDSVTAVPQWAASNGLSGVRRDIRSWRGVHGSLMERLARVRPRGVLWDFYFRTPQAGDAKFVRGTLALESAGVPVVLAVQRYHPDGLPDLSPRLYGPLSKVVRHGLILARDQVIEDGQIVLALRQGEHIHPALALAALGAIVYPHREMLIDWAAPSTTLRLVHHPRAGGSGAPIVDAVHLTSTVEVVTAHAAARIGDIAGIKGFTLARPEFWAGRTIAYRDAVRASDEELARLFSGKIVLFGDLRKGGWLKRRDRHRVRYNTEIVEDVPGCYLLADAVAGLIANRSHSAGNTRAASLTTFAFVGVVLVSALACLLPARLGAARRLRTPRVRVLAVMGLFAGASACAAVMVLVRTWTGVHAGLLGTALCAAGGASLVIEFARNRHQLPANQ